MTNTEQIAAMAERIERLERALRETTGALDSLFAMVQGEAPSLLEDDQHFDMCNRAIRAGNVALLSSGDQG